MLIGMIFKVFFVYFSWLLCFNQFRTLFSKPTILSAYSWCSPLLSPRTLPLYCLPCSFHSRTMCLSAHLSSYSCSPCPEWTGPTHSQKRDHNLLNLIGLLRTSYSPVWTCPCWSEKTKMSCLIHQPLARTFMSWTTEVHCSLLPLSWTESHRWSKCEGCCCSFRRTYPRQNRVKRLWKGVALTWLADQRNCWSL